LENAAAEQTINYLEGITLRTVKYPLKVVVRGLNKEMVISINSYRRMK
jgi:hypothetical protein